jgi:PAT family beta-lactamase induction signal transducer AmpG
MNDWTRSVSAYRDPRVLGILLLGFSSGLPFLLTLSTLSLWLTKEGISVKIIGAFALATIPYTFKFLWAPLIDQIRIPFLCSFFGQRRGWLLTTQLSLIVALVGLGSTDPSQNIMRTTMFALFVAFCSASQDIVIEAYRIERLKKSQSGYGAGASVIGYRIGMLVSGAGALYLAAYFSWFVVYCIMAGCVVVGIITALLSTEPRAKCHYVSAPFYSTPNESLSIALRRWFSLILSQPLYSFFKSQDWMMTISFILLYKVGDTVLSVMSMPFLIEIGFSEIEIAHVAKTFGISAMMVGGVIGGILLSRCSIIENLRICITLQTLASLLFMVQASVGANLSMLFLTMGVENLACGMSQAALIAYFSSLCLHPNTATHFALLSSFGSFARITLSVLAGWLADYLNSWVSFYAFVAFGCLPALFVLWAWSHRFIGTKGISTKEAKVAP